MSANNETLYIKIDQCVMVYDRNVTLGDIASITSSNEAMVRQLKQMKIHQFLEKPNVQREMFSILTIIALIHEEYPNAEIDNEGEKDFIIEYAKNPRQAKAIVFLKTVLISILIFFGAAFTIMSFNNDISVTELFETFYYQVMGSKSDGMTELEASYCLGVAIGILVFFNHFGKKKLDADPTPLQVQMRKFEKELDMTYIENAARGGKEIDVQ
ncbi:MAG: stage V sporulation protein AA [Lachnospiraceae bacterium]|nr:stage V sporulation protein AA [Lachnospiraceae bacterium]